MSPFSSMLKASLSLPCTASSEFTYMAHLHVAASVWYSNVIILIKLEKTIRQQKCLMHDSQTPKLTVWILTTTYML
jgi:hypothetical protein